MRNEQQAKRNEQSATGKKVTSQEPREKSSASTAQDKKMFREHPYKIHLNTCH